MSSNRALVIVASLSFSCACSSEGGVEEGTGGEPGVFSTGGGTNAAGGSTGTGAMSSGGANGSGGTTASGGGLGSGGLTGIGGMTGAGGEVGVGGLSGTGGITAAGGAGSGGTDDGTGGTTATEEPTGEAVDEGTFSFFVTSWLQLGKLAEDEGRGNKGFGGDLRYPSGEMDGLKGADNICQKLADNAGFGDVHWRAFLSTSKVDAIDHILGGPWYDYHGDLIANDKSDLTGGSDRLGAAKDGTYDEVGTLHDGNGDVNDDGISGDDDHDTMTATKKDGTYYGFSCDDWTSITAKASGNVGGLPPAGGIQMGHSWAAFSGNHWSDSHGGHQCAPGTEFDAASLAGTPDTVGGGGGYGGFYCFASK